jgi:hypothetical protein
MVKDPFFQFRVDDTLPDVSNVHVATSVPVCDADNVVTQLEITVADGSSVAMNASKVTFLDDCRFYFRADSNLLFGGGNFPAKNLIAPGFGSEEERILERLEDGTFDQQAIADSVVMMDARVVDQTIDPFLTASPTVAPAPFPDTPSSTTISPRPLPTTSPTVAPAPVPDTPSSTTMSQPILTASLMFFIYFCICDALLHHESPEL